MRVDLFLKLSRLAKSRSEAQRLCDNGKVKIGGISIKAARELRGGQRLEIELQDQVKYIEVLRLPENKQVSRADSRKLYSFVIE